MDETRAALRRLLASCLKQGDFTLASGRKSDWYLDCRLITLTPEGSALAGALCLAEVRRLGATAVCGLSMGADPLVTATGVLAHQAGVPLRLAYVRKQPKEHGTGKQVEGPPLSAADKVIVLEDVVTTAGSALQAARTVKRETGANIVACVALVDREEGGHEALAAEGIPLTAFFRKAELASVEEYEKSEQERDILQTLVHGEKEIAEGTGHSLDSVMEEADELLDDEDE